MKRNYSNIYQIFLVYSSDIIILFFTITLIHISLFGRLKLTIGDFTLLSAGDVVKTAMWLIILVVARWVFLPQAKAPVYIRYLLDKEIVERYAFWILLGIVAVGAFWTIPYMAFHVSVSDTYGYLSEAMAILDGRVYQAEDVFTPLGLEPIRGLTCQIAYLQATDGVGRVPVYPVGWPLHVAMFATTCGREVGPFYGQIVVSLLMVVFVFMAGRELYDARVGLLAAFLLICSTIWQAGAMVLMSDNCASLWVVVSFYGLLKARNNERWALLCGFALSVAVLCRPNLALTALWFGCWFAIQRDWKALVLFIVSALPIATFQAVWQYSLYGSPFRTGYGATNILFSWHNLLPYSAFYSEQILKRHGYIWPILTLIGLFWGKEKRNERVLLFLLFTQLFVFYSFYTPGYDWISGRFFLPWLWGILLLTAVGVFKLNFHYKREKQWFVCLIALVILLSSSIKAMKSDQKDSGFRNNWRTEEMRYLDTVCIRYAVEPTAVIYSYIYSGTLRFYQGCRTLNWNNVSESDFWRSIELLTRHKVPLYLVNVPNFSFTCPYIEQRPDLFKHLFTTEMNVELYRIQE